MFYQQLVTSHVFPVVDALDAHRRAHAHTKINFLKVQVSYPVQLTGLCSFLVQMKGKMSKSHICPKIVTFHEDWDSGLIRPLVSTARSLSTHSRVWNDYAGFLI